MATPEHVNHLTTTYAPPHYDGGASYRCRRGPGAVAGQQLGRRILTVGPGWGFGKRLSPIFSVNPSLVPFHPELVDLMTPFLTTSLSSPLPDHRPDYHVCSLHYDGGASYRCRRGPGAVAGQQLGRRILTVGPGWGFGKRLSPIFSVNPSLVPFHPELVDLMAPFLAAFLAAFFPAFFPAFLAASLSSPLPDHRPDYHVCSLHYDGGSSYRCRRGSGGLVYCHPCDLVPCSHIPHRHRGPGTDGC